MDKMFEAARPRIKNLTLRPIIFGTGGSMEGQYLSMFFKPESYGYK